MVLLSKSNAILDGITFGRYYTMIIMEKREDYNIKKKESSEE